MTEKTYTTRCPMNNHDTALCACMICPHGDVKNFFKFWTVDCVFPKKVCK